MTAPVIEFRVVDLPVGLAVHIIGDANTGRTVVECAATGYSLDELLAAVGPALAVLAEAQRVSAVRWLRRVATWRDRQQVSVAEIYTLGYQAGFGERLRQDVAGGLRPRLTLVR